MRSNKEAKVDRIKEIRGKNKESIDNQSQLFHSANQDILFTKTNNNFVEIEHSFSNTSNTVSNDNVDDVENKMNEIMSSTSAISKNKRSNKCTTHKQQLFYTWPDTNNNKHDNIAMLNTSLDDLYKRNIINKDTNKTNGANNNNNYNLGVDNDQNGIPLHVINSNSKIYNFFKINKPEMDKESTEVKEARNVVKKGCNACLHKNNINNNNSNNINNKNSMNNNNGDDKGYIILSPLASTPFSPKGDQSLQ